MQDELRFDAERVLYRGGGKGNFMKTLVIFNHPMGEVTVARYWALW